MKEGGREREMQTWFYNGSANPTYVHFLNFLPSEGSIKLKLSTWAFKWYNCIQGFNGLLQLLFKFKPNLKLQHSIFLKMMKV